MMCVAENKNKAVSHNSLDRRYSERVNTKAEILTFDTEFRRAHVIECDQRGARVVLTEKVSQDDIIGVVVVRGHRRTRTFARVAWTTLINDSRAVAGLEFLKLGFRLTA